MNLEDDLRRALKRTDPPPDFASRVITRIEREAGRPRTGGRFVTLMPVRQWLAAAATLALVAWGGARYYEHQQQVAQAERIQEEITLAMQITGEALARVQAKLQDASR